MRRLFFWLVIAISLTIEVCAQPVETDEVMATIDPTPKYREWPDTRLGKLLGEIEVIQASGEMWQGTAWPLKVKEAIELGPSTSAELITLLDETADDHHMMMRTLVFLLRATNDKRAIPALIRTLPRCYQQSDSDYGKRVEDVELWAFMQEHEAIEYRDDRFSFGRPITEIFATLRRWTGERIGQMEIIFVQKDEQDSPRIDQIKRLTFWTIARRWELWWDEHWQEYTEDPNHAHVGLILPQEEPIKVEPLDVSKRMQLTGKYQTRSVESPMNPGASQVFYDIDTGRMSGLPEPWSQMSREEITTAKPMIQIWAAQAGYDLMGWEETIDGQTRSVVIPIRLRLWMLNAEIEFPLTLTMESLMAAGRSVSGPFGGDLNDQPAQKLPGFFFITSENTVGIIELKKVLKKPQLVLKSEWFPNEEPRVYFHQGWQVNVNVCRPDK